MAIDLICQKCATNLSVRSKIFKKCGYEFKNGKRYSRQLKIRMENEFHRY
jgi:hypothetical protein